MNPRRHNAQHGFTLVELMISVAILAILSSLAYAGYQSQLLKGNRAAAESFMMDIALRQQQRFLDTRAFAADLAALGMTAPENVSNAYTVTVAPTAGTRPGFLVSAVPVGRQAKDPCATLTLDATNTKTPVTCW